MVVGHMTAEGHQRSLSQGQEVPDFLSLTYPGCLELLQPFASSCQLLRLPLDQLFLLVCPLPLPEILAVLHEFSGKLTGEDLGAQVFQALSIHL
jgi:hypothetical protein